MSAVGDHLSRPPHRRPPTQPATDERPVPEVQITANTSQRSSRAVGGAEAVVVEGLTKRYGGRAAVDNLSFAIPTGTVAGLIGPCASRPQKRNWMGGDERENGCVAGFDRAVPGSAILRLAMRERIAP